MPSVLSRRTATGPPTQSNDEHEPETDETPVDATPANRQAFAQAPADRLRSDYAAVRVSFTWLGVRKTLSPEQKAQAAEGFGAEGNYLSATKKLLDTRHPAYLRVTAVRNQIVSYWRGLSLPYPDAGVRLIRRQDVEPFDRRMSELRQELGEAVAELDRQLKHLQADARDRLGSLYNPQDYPESLGGLFAVEWDWPAVEEDAGYLRRLNPVLYEQEQRRVAARFDEAVKLAEEAFTAEFSTLVSHLVERLTASPDGQKKVFRDSAITNLTDFFDRFRNLSVRSNADLDQLVATARQVLRGADPASVRENQSLRQQVNRQLATVQSSLDSMLVDQPRRRILRHGQREGSA